MAPCIGQGIGFNFEFSYLLWNNLGGQGPDQSNSPVMRFANAGVVYHPISGAIYFDIEISNTTDYVPADSLFNGFVNSRFAQINLACGESAGLRATIKRSCATAPSCKNCAAMSGSLATTCYTNGCACVGTLVTAASGCTNAQIQIAKNAYTCSLMNNALVLTGDSLVTICLLYTSPSPRDRQKSRMPSSA